MRYTLAIPLLFLLFACIAEKVDGAELEDPNMQALPEVVKRTLLKGDVEVRLVQSIGDLPLLDVWLSDGQHFMVSTDGEWMISGDLLMVVGEGEYRNLSEEQRENDLASSLSAATSPVVFPARGDTRQVLYVFTDVDCGYCRRFHSQIQQYNEMGLEVHYLAYPRMGMKSEAAEKMQRIWCSRTPNAQMTVAKRGDAPKGRMCGDDIISEHYALGRQIRLRGTPALVSERGEYLGGYFTPDELKKLLGL